MCAEDEAPCTAAGYTFLPAGPVTLRGVVGVSNANQLDHATLAHETGHSLGLDHDKEVGGFMNTGGGHGDLALLDDTNMTVFEASMADKASPRSSGWDWTGCTEANEEATCSPDGKPGWACNGIVCEQE